MTSISPDAIFAPSSATTHTPASIAISEALAKATQHELQVALAVLNDDLLATLSAFADAICQDRALGSGTVAA